MTFKLLTSHFYGPSMSWGFVAMFCFVGCLKLSLSFSFCSLGVQGNHADQYFPFLEELLQTFKESRIYNTFSSALIKL